MSERIEAEVQDIANRISLEVRGSTAHAMVVDYLKLLRRELHVSISATPDIQLPMLKAQIQLTERILSDITRNVVERLPPKTGGYTV